MSYLIPFLSLGQPANAAIGRSMEQLEALGYQVERTFDLHAARLAHVACSCPRHGTSDCSCQMVVLLIYGMNISSPVALIIHGNDAQTSLSLVDEGHQNVGTMIVQALSQETSNAEEV